MKKYNIHASIIQIIVNLYYKAYSVVTQKTGSEHQSGSETGVYAH